MNFLTQRMLSCVVTFMVISSHLYSCMTNLEDWFKVDPLLPEDLQRERETMDNMLNCMEFKELR